MKAIEMCMDSYGNEVVTVRDSKTKDILYKGPANKCTITGVVEGFLRGAENGVLVSGYRD